MTRVLTLLLLPLVMLALAETPLNAASFVGVPTSPTEWSYTLTYDPYDNYAVCPPPDDIATITLTGMAGVIDATAPTSTDFLPPGGTLDVINLAWHPEVSFDGTTVTWTHFGSGTGNFRVPKHVYGFKVITASPSLNGAVNVASSGFSIDVSGRCPVQPSDDRDFVGITGGPVGPLEEQVAIDIKPGSFPNAINLRSRGVIPLSVLTTETFDATIVDVNTVRFGRTGSEAVAVHSAVEDVDEDGDMDLILHFRTQTTGIQCGDNSAELTGHTREGSAIRGSDSIKTLCL